MNNHLDSYNNVLNKGNQIYQKKEFQKPNNLFNNCPSFPNKAKDIKQFLNDSMIIENIQNNLNPNRMPFLKKEILDYKNDKNESINENNNNISKLILYEIKKLNKIILKVNDNIKVSTNKIEGKIDGIDSFLRKKREREKIEREKERKEIQEYNANENNKIKKLDLDFSDRSLIFENITIFWKDFCSFCEYPIVPLNYYSLGQVGLKNKKYDGKSLALSLQKIERLGIIQVDYLATLATISSQNIDRFHLNEIGRKLIEYIDD
jgi:hypothetical protein